VTHDPRQHPEARYEEQQGPASLHQQGPAAGYGVQELGQPVQSQNAQEVMEQHFDHPKRHPQ
jgi:hypothetical protein